MPRFLLFHDASDDYLEVYTEEKRDRHLNHDCDEVTGVEHHELEFAKRRASRCVNKGFKQIHPDPIFVAHEKGQMRICMACEQQISGPELSFDEMFAIVELIKANRIKLAEKREERENAKLRN